MNTAFFRPLINVTKITMLSLSLYIPATWAKYSDLFEVYPIVVDFNVNQPAVIADLFPQEGMELILVGVDKQQQTQLAIYSLDVQTNTFVERDKIKIPDNVFAFDVGEPQQNGQQQLYLLEKEQVQRYEPAHLSHPSAWIVAETVSSMYRTENADSFTQMNFIQDINNDGLDDVILPHFEQLNLWLSDCCGARHPQVLPITAHFEINQQGVTYDEQDRYFQDMNSDGKTDLVTVQQGLLKVFTQKANRQFSTSSLNISVADSIHGIDWWEMKDPNGQPMDQSNITHRAIKNIDDLNGDNIPDMAVQYTKSSGVLDKTIDFEFFYGEFADGVLRYPESANTSITSDETLSDLQFIDRDVDGKQEISVSSFDIGISQIVGALLSGSIDQDVLLFEMDSASSFSKKPLVSQEVEITFSLSSGTRGQPLVRFMDINGDEVKDIVYSDGDEVLRVLLATPEDKKAYARRSLRQKITLPKNPFDAATEDINADGKTDVVLHHGPADSSELLKRVLVLLAK